MEEDLQGITDDDFIDNLRKSREETTDDVTEETNTLISAESQGELILKKCIRRGDKVCYSKLENINMLQNANKRDSYVKKSSFDATNQADKVMSGESLYKAFTFQQGSNDEETEKCIAFWKGVMEKNLAPIKCTIIETTKSEGPPEVDEKKESVPELDEEKLKSEMTKIHDQYKTMWMTLLNDLQKKKLHDIKLIGKSRCKICDSPLEEELHKVSKSEIQKEIEELNNWVPKSKSRDRPLYKDNARKPSKHGSMGSTKIDTRKSMDNVKKRISQTKSPEAPVFPEILVDSEPPTEPVQPAPPPPDTNTYEYIDIIGEKKKSGAYSEWRTNKVESPCPCGYPDCDCNTNPAIVSMEVPSDLKFTAVEEVIADEDVTEEERGKDEEPKGMTEEERSKLEKAEDIMDKKLSVMLNCLCSSSDCDCKPFIEILKKASLSAADDIIIAPPTVVVKRKSSGKVSSLELIAKRLRPKHKMSIDERGTRKSDPIVYSGEAKENDEMLSKKCTCSDEDCDCNKAEEIKEEKIVKECLCTYPCDCEGKIIVTSKEDVSSEDQVYQLPNDYSNKFTKTDIKSVSRNGKGEEMLNVVDL